MNQNDSINDQHHQQSDPALNDDNQIKINLNYNFVSYEDPNHLNELFGHNKGDGDDSKSLDEITFRYEHHRSETFAHFVQFPSSDSKEDSLNYSSSSVYDESDDDHHRKFRRQIYEEDFRVKIIPDVSPTTIVDDKQEEEVQQSKSRKLFPRQLSKCLSSTTNDLHSLFKKLSCLKRISSVVDLTHHKTTETLLKKKPRRLTYQNGKTLTKSDIIHCQQFDQIKESNDAKQQQSSENLEKSSSSSLIVPKLHIEEIAINGDIQIEQTDPVQETSSTRFDSQQTSTKIFDPDHKLDDHQTFIIYSSSEPANDLNNINTHHPEQYTISQSISLSNFHPVPKSKQSSESVDCVEHSSPSNYRSICLPSNHIHLPPAQSPATIINSESEYFSHSTDKNKKSKMIANQQNNHFESQNSQQNQPSYVNISRVNHGYVPYNRYTSEYRRDDSLLRSPVEDLESLYGESFADDWNKSRVKKGQSIEKSIHPNTTETSPTNQIKTTLASSKLFQKINSVDNSESSEDNKSNNNSFDKDWWLREHQPHSHKNHDGQAFMEKIQEQKARIQNKIQQGEKWLANTKDIPEECIGKIRSAIGKANLLLDKKFQQFQKLCEDSINQADGEQFKIQSDDLQGFWDMVMIQVHDVNQSFDELIQFKQNHWKPSPQLDQIDSNSKTMSPKIGSRQPSSNMTTIHNNTSSPRKYDNNNKITANINSPRNEERQRRLMEIKRRGKMTMKQDSDEIRIFAPSK
ncbi:aggresome assembly [Dermatophagoides farinae]|uniref:Aggresome assembly n=1 Tax=Dermatophagoides farinae TaxID=6954 RepID=A0A922L9G8_DERFA|nr:aggresome assembly [Dermatophagoides farinae]